jgi:hypothetical protein
MKGIGNDDQAFCFWRVCINKQLFARDHDGDGVNFRDIKNNNSDQNRERDPVDRTTLREGEFYAHIRIDAFSDRFEVGSDV